MNYEFTEYIPYILGGLKYTVFISLMSLGFALILGLVVGMMRASPFRRYRYPATVFVEFFRGTSEVVQFYWLFFALPLLLAIRVAPVSAAIIVIGITQGAYIAEIVRGSLQAVPRGQLEAARALNMSKRVTMQRIVLPQAYATMLPSLGNSTVEIIKNTSIVSLVTVADITFRAQHVRGVVGNSLLVYSFLLLLYLSMTTVATLIFRWLESRLPVGLANNAGSV